MYSLAEKTIYLRDRDGGKIVMCLLSDEGYEVYKAGGKVDFRLGHILCLGDYQRLLKADFS